MLAYRVPKILDAQASGEDSSLTLSCPASSCFNCGVPLKWYLNLPFLGFFLSRKATPCCGIPLAWNYLLFESAAVLWAASVWFFFEGKPLDIWGWSIFGWVLLVAAYIDWRTQWLPDIFTLFLLWTGLVFTALGDSSANLPKQVLTVAGVYCVLTAFAWLFKLLRSIDGIGGGDIKLLAAFAAWLPLSGLPYVLLGGSCLQLFVMLLLRQKKSSFGPALCIAAVFVTFIHWRGFFAL